MATSDSARWPSYGTKSGFYGDIESGGIDSPELRWGFIRKVYGILAAQMVLTFACASFIFFNEPYALYISNHWWIPVLSAIIPFMCICALAAYSQQHPLNLIILGIFSISFSITLGTSCALLKNPKIVSEALFLTALITVALTAYTFWAVRRGEDFGFLGPTLYCALWVLIGLALLQVFFPGGSLGSALVAGCGVFVFSLYIIYDTSNLLTRFGYDEYIWASLSLYLDIINLFTYLLELLSALQGNQD